MASDSASVTSKRVSVSIKNTISTKSTTQSSKSKRSSAYDTNFGQHCIDHNIYPPIYKFPDGSRPPKPANYDEIRSALMVPRASLSPSLVPKIAFDDFQDKSATRSEGTVMRTVVPIIIGDVDIPNEGHLRFNNLTSITDGTTVNPAPDFFDGAHPGSVDSKVRDDLSETIVPNKKHGIPLTPNFFLEAKGPRETLEGAEGQAVLDGAHGALIMHALQNYLLDEPIYDGNAYAYSCTLLGGYLTMYAHHLAAPAHSGERPAHYTTQVKAYALRDEDFYWEGMGAFRNLRLRAKEDRDRFIQTANIRAGRRNAEAADTDEEDPVNTI
jgi:hypothetical protein